MRIEQRISISTGTWDVRAGGLDGPQAQLLLVFGDRARLEHDAELDALRALYPKARIVAASTSGEIVDTEVTEGRLVATAIAFDRATFDCAETTVASADGSYEAGCRLADMLKQPDLVHVFVLSDGQLVNGTELARGFNEHLPAGVHLSGGLAGDGTRFERTVVGLDSRPTAGRIVAIGLSGKSLRVGFGSAGGWGAFGPERVVTRSAGNTLYELDGQSALRLYKKYLGDQAAALPGSALRFPLCVTPPGTASAVVRTILSIDEQAEGMRFAGDIPMGARVRFMRASYEDLIDGAARAAEQTRDSAAADLVICISCVGRRIVLGQRIEEETECVRAAVGAGPILTGFYSYGELAPAGASVACQLHNQTMTITTLREE